MTGFGSGGGESDSIKKDSLGGCLGGCFFSKTSRTVSTLLLSGSTIPCPTEVYQYHCCLLLSKEQHKLFLPSSALEMLLLCVLAHMWTCMYGIGCERSITTLVVHAWFTGAH